MPPRDVPHAVRPHLYLGFAKAGESGQEWFGDCLFCGKANKLYINTQTGQFSCKSGRCGREGNVYKFLEEYYLMLKEENQADWPWQALADDRGLPLEVLHDAGLAWNGTEWIVPVRNLGGTYLNLRLYKSGGKIRGLPGLDAQPWFPVLPIAGEIRGAGNRCWLAEGEWDALALQTLLSRDLPAGEDSDHIVIGLPGAGIFKDAWQEFVRGKEVIAAFDKDAAGEKGVQRLHAKLHNVARSFRCVQWPDPLPEGFDLRDFFRQGGTLEALEEVVQPYTPQHATPLAPATQVTNSWPLLRAGGRPSWDEVMEVYNRWLLMTEDMQIALRVIYATIISNQVEGDPLWMHIVSPPGTGKTELLMSSVGCDAVFAISTLTPNTLVSGFSGPGGSDPSLIPKINGKTLVLKDFTEVLRMQRQDKENIYSTLRGAFDGEVFKPYGNMVTRHYADVHFSILSGVTPALFSEQAAIVGERFLVLHMLKGVGFDATDIILAALSNSGHENKMRSELGDVARRFLSYRIEPEDMPEVPVKYLYRLVALSQLVSMLRAIVERDLIRDTIPYRPQHEAGTRLGKQLLKLFRGLVLLGESREVTDAEYAIVARVALDTCIGFNLEILYALAAEDGQTAQELAEACGIPLQTLRDQLEDLVQLGALCKHKQENPVGRGAPIVRYHRSPIMKQHWDRAGLNEIAALPEESMPVRRSRRLRKRRER